MYRLVLPSGHLITMGVQTFLVDDSILEYKYIAWSVCRLRLNRLGDLSVMQAEHLQQWLINSTWQNTPDTTNYPRPAPHTGTLTA